MQEFHTILSPLGALTATASDGKLLGLQFGTRRMFYPLVQKAYKPNDCTRNHEVFKQTARWLEIYFSGKCPSFMPELELIGSDFQRSVWQAMLRIPYGQTRAYSDIERYLEQKYQKEAHALAVGSAAAKNPLAIIIPCHRVILADGTIGEYNAGVFRKQRLLAIEGVHFL